MATRIMESKGTTGTWSGWVGVLLLALPFAGVGVVMTVVTVRSLWFAYEARQWSEVPATIVSVDCKGHSGKSSTWETRASYRYTINGRLFVGYRVSIHTGGDNIGTFQRRAYEELKRHQEAGQPFRCFVNPHDPADSLLYRDPRWEMIGFKSIFAVVFGGIGFGLIAGVIYGRRREARERELKRQHPEEPWLWDPSWATGVIRSSNKAEMAVATGIALAWNAFACPVAFHVLTEPGLAQEKARLFVLLFPLAGIGLAAWALTTALRYRKYGTSTLRLSRMPGVIGGPLAGAVQVPVHVMPENGFHVTLRCIHRYTTGSGKNRNTHEVVLWEDERVIGRELYEGDASRSAIPVLFAIPRNSQPTRPEPASDQIVWRLEVSAKTPGLDYASRFEVPVFVTPDSASDFRLDESPIAKYEKKVEAAELLRDQGLRLEQLPDRRVLVFPAARHKGSALMLTVFAAIWTVIVVAMAKGGAPLFMTLIFGLVDLGVLWGVLVLWLESRRLEIAAHEITLQGGLLGLGRTQRLERSEVADVFSTAGMQSGNQSFFTLKLRTKDGRSFTVGARILGNHNADVLAAELTNWTAGRTSERP